MNVAASVTEIQAQIQNHTSLMHNMEAASTRPQQPQYQPALPTYAPTANFNVLSQHHHYQNNFQQGGGCNQNFGQGFGNYGNGQRYGRRGGRANGNWRGITTAQQQPMPGQFRQQNSGRGFQPHNMFKYHNNLNYCWTHRHNVGDQQTSATCMRPKPGHVWTATKQFTCNVCNCNSHKVLQNRQPQQVPTKPPANYGFNQY